MKERACYVRVWQELAAGKSMVFLSGPRQAGKTTFAKLIANNREPFLLLEAKLTDTQPSKSLIYFQRTLNIPAVQLTGSGDGYSLVSNGSSKVLIAPAYQWLAQMP